MPPRRMPHMSAIGVAACIALLALATSVFAAREAGGAIDPGTRVNGMLVVQGDKRDADGWLFDTICDPFVRSPGRRTRTCGQLLPLGAASSDTGPMRQRSRSTARGRRKASRTRHGCSGWPGASLPARSCQPSRRSSQANTLRNDARYADTLEHVGTLDPGSVG